MKQPRPLTRLGRVSNGVLALGWLLALVSWCTGYLLTLVAGGLLINGFAFWLMVKDKRAARHKRLRVPERTLLWLAVLGGAAGVGAAMLAVRHKTRHGWFLLAVPCALLIHLLLILCLFGNNTLVTTAWG